MINKEGFLAQRKIPYYRRDDELCFSCPFCTDTRFRFGIGDRNNMCSCMNCGWVGSFEDFVQKLLGLNDEAVYKLIHETGLPRRYTPRVHHVEEEAVRIDYPEGHYKLAMPLNPRNKVFWKYLKSRDVSPSTAMDYSMGYCRSGHYRYRVIVPVFWDNVMVSWVARDITGTVAKQMKALTPLGNHQSRYLLNFDRLKGAKELVLVEGPFDMLKIPDMAVASFGKRLSTEQKLLLKSHGVKHLILAYDNDAGDDVEAMAFHLSRMFEISIVDLPPGEDPGSLPAAVVRDLVAHAKRYSWTPVLK